MLTKESYKELLEKIVIAQLPEESIAFQLQGDEMVTEIVNREWAGHKDGHTDTFGFADLAAGKTVLDVALVAVSTFKVLLELKKLRTPKQEEQIDLSELRKRWNQRLRQAGLKPAKADAIVNDFAHELLDLSKP